jgi:hypothetical protein
MKNTICFAKASVLAVAALALFNSCTKLADENYNQIVLDRFTPTSSDLLSLLAPAYSTWRPLYLGI